MSQTSSLLNPLLDFIFPPLCVGCEDFTDDPIRLCQNCRNKIENINHPFCINCKSLLEQKKVCPFCRQDQFLLYTITHYHPPIVDIIIKYKFKRITHTIDYFIDRFAINYADLINDFQDCVLHPIPLFWTREYFRGYNQALFFAEHLSAKFNIPLRADLLFRSKHNPPQARIPIKKRKANIENVFSVDRSQTEERKIILVDDVVTSGHTVCEAKNCLEQAQMKVAGVISMAQAF